MGPILDPEIEEGAWRRRSGGLTQLDHGKGPQSSREAPGARLWAAGWASLKGAPRELPQLQRHWGLRLLEMLGMWNVCWGMRQVLSGAFLKEKSCVLQLEVSQGNGVQAHRNSTRAC